MIFHDEEMDYWGAFRKLIVSFAVGILLGLVSVSASAEYNSRKLGEAAGAYLNAVDMILQLQESKCGYLFKKKTYSFDRTVKEVLSYLRPNDQKELQAFLDGEEFRKGQEDNKRTIQESLRSLGGREGYDEKTICGMILSNTAMVHEYAKQKWEYAKSHYTK
ncbi:MAG: hypothetical protein HY081_11725 [Gammaproteobacteria bacterium]|nr:hypothetical protein [Gammaproteobacteria bacterium]